MAFSRVQKSTPVSITSGTFLTGTWPQETGTGKSRALLAVISFSTWPSNPTITPDTNPWVELVRSDTASTSRAGVVIYGIIGPTAAISGDDTFLLGADSDASLELFEYVEDGGLTVVQSQVGENINTTGSATADSGTTPSNTYTSAVALAILNSRPNADAGPPYDASQSSPTNSFSLVTETESRNDAQGVHAGSYEKFISASGAVNVSATLVAACYWAGAVVVLGGDPAYVKAGAGIVGRV